jgi:hypothetical protein
MAVGYIPVIYLRDTTYAATMGDDSQPKLLPGSPLTHPLFRKLVLSTKVELKVLMRAWDDQ